MARTSTLTHWIDPDACRQLADTMDRAAADLGGILRGVELEGGDLEALRVLSHVTRRTSAWAPELHRRADLAEFTWSPARPLTAVPEPSWWTRGVSLAGRLRDLVFGAPEPDAPDAAAIRRRVADIIGSADRWQDHGPVASPTLVGELPGTPTGGQAARLRDLIVELGTSGGGGGGIVLDALTPDGLRSLLLHLVDTAQPIAADGWRAAEPALRQALDELLALIASGQADVDLSAAFRATELLRLVDLRALPPRSALAMLQVLATRPPPLPDSPFRIADQLTEDDLSGLFAAALDGHDGRLWLRDLDLDDVRGLVADGGFALGRAAAAEHARLLDLDPATATDMAVHWLTVIGIAGGHTGIGLGLGEILASYPGLATGGLAASGAGEDVDRDTVHLGPAATLAPTDALVNAITSLELAGSVSLTLTMRAVDAAVAGEMATATALAELAGEILAHAQRLAEAQGRLDDAVQALVIDSVGMVPGIGDLTGVGEIVAGIVAVEQAARRDVDPMHVVAEARRTMMEYAVASRIAALVADAPLGDDGLLVRPWGGSAERRAYEDWLDREDVFALNLTIGAPIASFFARGRGAGETGGGVTPDGTASSTTH